MVSDKKIFSSPEPKAHGELLWSLTVRRRRRCRRPDVRLSTIFKQHLLLNHWWEFDLLNKAWIKLVEGHQRNIPAKLYWNQFSGFWQEDF